MTAADEMVIPAWLRWSVVEVGWSRHLAHQVGAYCGHQVPFLFQQAIGLPLITGEDHQNRTVLETTAFMDTRIIISVSSTVLANF